MGARYTDRRFKKADRAFRHATQGLNRLQKRWSLEPRGKRSSLDAKHRTLQARQTKALRLRKRLWKLKGKSESVRFLVVSDFSEFVEGSRWKKELGIR